MRKTIVSIAVVLMAIGGFLATRGYENGVGVHAQLTSTSTVQDFRVASKKARALWLENMCRDGACLDAIDWKCGFSFTSADPRDFKTEAGREIFVRDIRKKRECFEKLAMTAPMTDTLDKLRILCGRRLMVFIGDRDYKPEDCEKAGGEWGKKRPVFSDEERYFEK